jgi:hypothetical protein
MLGLSHGWWDSVVAHPDNNANAAQSRQPSQWFLIIFTIGLKVLAKTHFMQ